jgi:hypothetical protein
MLQLMLGYDNNISVHHITAQLQIVLPNDLFLTASVKALKYVSLKMFPANLREDLNFIFTQYFFLCPSKGDIFCSVSDVSAHAHKTALRHTSSEVQSDDLWVFVINQRLRRCSCWPAAASGKERRGCLTCFVFTHLES